MSQDTNTLIEENQGLHRMLSEKDYQLVNINIKLLNMEDQMKKLIEQNKNMEVQLSRLMSYLESFATDVSHDLHLIKYK
jgi:hypothetical protein